MSNAFAKLKKGKDFSKLTAELEKIQSPQQTSSNRDDRFWKPTTDKTGNGYAVIRFLPPPADEDLPWVRVFTHGFKGPGGWFIENSLTTLGKKCPVSEANTELWNTGTTENQNLARERKRKLKYYSNIYVVSDPAHPENEGKVFLYQFGKKIFDKISDIMQPAFEDEEPINPFDLWEGANFKLKIRTVDGYINYDKSEFDSVSALSDDDDELEAVFDKEYSLQEFVSPDSFKTYEQLKERLDRVLGTVSATRTAAEDMVEDTMEVPFAVEEPAPAPAKERVATVEDEEDDALSYFEKLANED